MLRLHVGPLQSWVDSLGEMRSPYDGFTMLDQSAQQRLYTGAKTPFVGWEFGIVADDWPPAESAKPMLIAADGGSGIPVHGLGSDEAEAGLSEVRPLLLSLLSWLESRGSQPRLFLRDAFQGHAGEPRDIRDALRLGYIDGLTMDVVSTERPGVYTGLVDVRSRSQLLEAWWPSAAGLLAGVSVSLHAPSATDLAVAKEGVVSERSLDGVESVFQTTKSFHNLGFKLLTRDQSWATVRARLDKRGWSDGKPVEFIPT